MSEIMENSNKKVVAITRPENRSEEAIKLVNSYGAEGFIAPTLELKLTNTESLKELMKHVEELDWLIFTSVTSIESIFKFYPDFLDNLNSKCKIAAIGHKTAELAIDKQLPIDLIPEDYTAEGLLEAFENIDINNKKIGVPRTFSARTILPEGLEKMGGKVILAESYKSGIPENTDKIKELIENIIQEKIDGIIFTSPLTVKNLFKIAKEENKEKKLSAKLSNQTLTVAIGPITGNILNELKVKHIYPKVYTVKDMIELMFKELDN